MNANASAKSVLAGRFLKEVETRPDANAIITDNAHVSFRQLGQMVGAIQQYLQQSGATTVGLYSPPSTTLVSAAWAALCSGIPYVPLSPTYPDERLRYMVHDSGVDTILAPESLHDEVRAIVGDLNVSITGVPALDSSHGPTNEAHDNSIAYILYTSGSTGTPKGVEIDHHALAHQMSWLAEALDLEHSARIVHKTPISFDASQWELLATGNGAATVVAAPEAYRDPDALLGTVRSHGVTHLQAVPTLLQALCEDEKFAECTSLQVVASGGEVLTQRLAQTLQETLPDARIVNLYGPTETTINSSHYMYTGTAGTPSEDPAVSIGTPVPGMEFHLLDEHGEVTVADTGELAIAGPQLAVGYHGLLEETQKRFVTVHVDNRAVRVYRTGDLVERAGGHFYFRGRTDSQVKIRGHRIELGEVRSAIENHEWARHAEVLTTHDANGSADGMAAFVELNPHEAALMDQGVHGAHHQSKASRVQVKAQVAGLGIREDSAGDAVELPVSAENHHRLRDLAFERKTYRDFQSTTTDLSQLSQLRGLVSRPREWEQSIEDTPDLHSLAFALRSLVQYSSEERLLPKYAYASPGALYGVQAYVSVASIAGIADGTYYLNPRTAALQPVHFGKTKGETESAVELILVGQRSVISSVYQTNVDEVLMFEAGHLLGTLDTVAPAAGYRVGDRSATPAESSAIISDAESDDRFVIGTWPLVRASSASPDPLSEVITRVELYGGGPGERGVYEWSDHGPRLVSEGPLVRRKDVIAINQRVYNQASFGLILTSDGSEGSYISLGRGLQRAELNDLNLGLMSSGYSSFTDRDLPAARRIKAFTATSQQSSYFALGGPVTPEQKAHTGMNEDLLHTQGPAEIIRADIAERLPHYMVPDSIRILDELPRTPNGKIDARALSDMEELQTADGAGQSYTAPSSLLEHELAQIWGNVLGREASVSVTAPFFSMGGNSISAVRLVRAIRTQLGVDLPIQAVFEQDTISKQAEAIQGGSSNELSRIVPLAGSGDAPIYLWPGLGGYPMNLRHLAERIAGEDSRCYGIQAFGLNENEGIDESIQSMAARDIEQLRRLNPEGPYTLIGYSFGARVAFEAAYQLEREGDRVDRVVLIAPGSPNVDETRVSSAGEGLYRDERFVRVLYSVFFTRTDGSDADRVVAATHDQRSFLSSIRENLSIDDELAERIAELVERTYSFEYTFTELEQRAVSAPVTIIRASGDDYSFLDSVANRVRYNSVELNADHYQVLQPPHVDTTAETVLAALNDQAWATNRRDNAQLPHISVKSFPAEYPETKRKEFLSKLTSLVSTTFGISDAAVSISLESATEHRDGSDASANALALAGSAAGGDR